MCGGPENKCKPQNLISKNGLIQKKFKFVWLIFLLRFVTKKSMQNILCNIFI